MMQKRRQTTLGTIGSGNVFADLGLGASIVATSESFPESVIARIRKIANSHPEIEQEIGGGLADLLSEPEGGGGFRP